MAKDNSLSILTHVLGIVTGFVGPLVILLASADKEVKKHARNALNWQISLLIYYVVVMILMIVSFVLVYFLVGFVLIPLVMLCMFALVIINLIFCIVAAVKAGEGNLWRYPLAIPFLKVE